MKLHRLPYEPHLAADFFEQGLTRLGAPSARPTLQSMLLRSQKVRHGESFLILDRNVPVARLEPLPPG